MVLPFRNRAYIARQTDDYYPVLTESAGVVNMVSGAYQVICGHAMRCGTHTRIFQLQASRTIDWGSQTFRIGLAQFAPGFITTACLAASAVVAYKRNWTPL